MPAEPVIQTHELSKVYRHPFFTWLIRAKALTDLSITINRGEVFGLLGPNGSGKSTTIKLLLGLIFPTNGHVSIFGKRPQDLSVKQRVGFLPEESYLYRFLDAEETLDFYGRLFELPPKERRRRMDALLDMVGLRQERRRPVVEFSKGMQRRIGIAQALINDPELVILDEPTTGLDPLGTREIKDLILELKRKGKTVLLSSHLLADVEDVCDRIAILYGGRVQRSGSVQDVLSREQYTQITAEMDEETVRQVTELIRKRNGPEAEIKVAPPQERLEHLFLRVVHDAQSQQVETSGVRASTGQLDFLSPSETPEGEAILESLVHEKQAEAPSAEEVTNIQPASLAKSALLNQLASGKGEEQVLPEETQSEEPVTPAEDADRNLLDKLVSGDDGS